MESSEQTAIDRPTKKYLRVKGNPTLETAVIAKFAAGQNKSQIANDLGVHRNVIANVLNESEVQQYIDYGRNRAVSLIPRSLDVVEHRLEKNDGTVACQVLRGVKVFQNESVVNNTTNIAAFGLAQLIEQKANSERPAIDVVLPDNSAKPSTKGRKKKAK